MLRINAALSNNTATVDNRFTNGNPATSVPATIVDAAWLNAIQEEIANVIEGAGLTLIEANESQLLAAVLALIAANPSNQNKAIFQAVCGTAPGCTHASLSAALADADVVAGSRILVTESETINTMITVSKANVLIEFQPGVTFSKGSATKGIQLNANGVRIRGGRFSGFNGGADKAIEIAAGSSHCMVSEARFALNTTDVDDLNGTAAVFGNITE